MLNIVFGELPCLGCEVNSPNTTFNIQYSHRTCETDFSWWGWLQAKPFGAPNRFWCNRFGAPNGFACSHPYHLKSISHVLCEYQMSNAVFGEYPSHPKQGNPPNTIFNI